MMQPLPALEALFETIYRYYPRGLSWDAPSYRARAEFEQLQASRTERSQEPRWPMLLKALQEDMPSCGVQDWTIPGYEACFRVHLHPPEYTSPRLPEYHTAVGLVSHIAPVYLIYISHRRRVVDRWVGGELDHSFEFVGPAGTYAHRLGRLVERVFGYPALPVTWAETVIADVQPDSEVAIGRARLIDCLFSANRW